MRRFTMIFLLLAFLPLSVMAAEVTCFSGKTRIYHGWGHDFAFNDSFMGFIEDKTNHVILVSGECIIMAPVNQGEKLNAIDLRKESAYA